MSEVFFTYIISICMTRTLFNIKNIQVKASSCTPFPKFNLYNKGHKTNKAKEKTRREDKSTKTQA